MPAPEWHLRRHDHGALACRVWPSPDRLHIRRGTVFGLTGIVPALISWTSEGSSVRQVVAETAPWALPWRRRFAERSAAEGQLGRWQAAADGRTTIVLNPTLRNKRMG
jgi:hypothetical protein